MKNIFKFESPREWYSCDAAILSCFDNRFDEAFAEYLKRIGIRNPDSIRLAGSAKNFSSPEKAEDREFVLEQLRKSIRLHATKRVILTVHSDCGAYGGLAAFGHDTKAEAAHHEQELKHAAEIVRQTFPELQVLGYFLDFVGVWEIDLREC